MKTIFTKNFLLLLTLVMGVTSAFAQRTITGTVYRDGEPAAGVEVTAHKSSSSHFTSFDGAYTLEISDKSKYIKFVFPDREERLDIEGKTDDVFDFAIGEMPVAKGPAGVDMRSHAELIKAKENDYIQAYSLFDQFMKQKDYKSALAPWETLYKTYPKSSPNVYIKGIKIYDSMIANASGAEKAELIKTEMSIFDQRAEMFGDKANIMGRKATKMLDLVLNNNMTDDEKTAAYKQNYPMLEEVVKNSGNDANVLAMIRMMQATKQLYKVGEFNADKVLANYDLTNTIIEANLAKDAKNEKYLAARAAVNRSFETSGAADCEALVKLYQPKFEANPNDVELLKKMMNLLSRNNCTDSDLFLQGAERMYETAPTASSALAMAQRYVKLDDKTKALQYYNEAVGMPDADDDLKGRVHYGMAAIYLGQKNLAKARDNARKAISFRSDWGAAYMMIGNIYASAARSFGSDEFAHQTVYWLACDYFAKAARVDDSVAAKARKSMGTYKQYFPTSEELFYQTIAVGSTYRIEGWINETTKVRAK